MTLHDHQRRALDAPFIHPLEWPPPIPGRCSRCGRPAALGERSWWHIGPPCVARRQSRLTAPIGAEFIPD